MHRRALAVAVGIAVACSTSCSAGEPARQYQRAVYYAKNGSVYTWVGSPVTYQLRQLWRLDERGTWQPVSVPKRAQQSLTLVPTGERVSLGLAEGDYFAMATVQGHSECQHVSVSEKHCLDVMLPPPPKGQVPTCLAGGRAGYVPDPMDLKLPDGTGVRSACGNNGFLSSENTRGNGVLDGPARNYDVHGKVVWSGTYRDGKLSGVVTEWLRDTRFETPYVDDKRHGTRKEFDASGRLVSSAEFVNGVYTRQETYHPNGVVASRVTMKGDLGSWIQYSPSGAKTREGRIVNSVSGSAHQCVAVYDAEGRSQPCPSP
ncbi:toxin-antitoxin system YwqK family antitoxin [Archangium gephyra]|uniref:toxin-antitoxin system YwqK family antitoxin n=1 Tax=Archangium gephyra TaxID=48 RepID=UPI003B75F4C7